MNHTINYLLRKPDETDIADIDDFNFNTDKIDDELKKVSNTVFDLTSQMNNVTLHSNLRYISVKNFICDDGLKVQGDGIHDDTSGIQKALDYAYEHNLIVKFDQGTYLISKPLLMWASSSNYNSKLTAIIGDDRQTTKIYKPNSSVTSLDQHTFANACIIIANDKYKKGGISSNTEAGVDVECYNGFISNISLICNKKCDGIYSRGIFFFNFENLTIDNALHGIVTETWNCYNYFKKIDFNKCNVACEFGTTMIGGQSTMNFVDCHCNGVDIYCYNIRGDANFYNCSIDGGLGTHYRIVGINRGAIGWIGGRINLYNCHSESPAIANDKPLIEVARGTMNIYNCTFEIPYLNYITDSSMFRVTNFSKCILNNCNIYLRRGASNCKGRFHLTDQTSIFKLNDTLVDREDFLNYRPYNYNINDYNSIINRQILDATLVNKFIRYVASNVSEYERTINSVNISNNRLVLSSRNNYNHDISNGFMFTKKIDLSNYSKLNIKGKLNYLNNSGTSRVGFSIGLNKDIVEDGYIKIGSVESMNHELSVYGDIPHNYSFEKAEYMVDISNIIGEYYICFLLNGTNIDLEIKECILIR